MKEGRDESPGKSRERGRGAVRLRDVRWWTTTKAKRNQNGNEAPPKSTPVSHQTRKGGKRGWIQRWGFLLYLLKIDITIYGNRINKLNKSWLRSWCWCPAYCFKCEIFHFMFLKSLERNLHYFSANVQVMGQDWRGTLVMLSLQLIHSTLGSNSWTLQNLVDLLLQLEQVQHLNKTQSHWCTCACDI